MGANQSSIENPGQKRKSSPSKSAIDEVYFSISSGKPSHTSVYHRQQEKRQKLAIAKPNQEQQSTNNSLWEQFQRENEALKRKATQSKHLFKLQQQFGERISSLFSHVEVLLQLFSLSSTKLQQSSLLDFVFFLQDELSPIHERVTLFEDAIQHIQSLKQTSNEQKHEIEQLSTIIHSQIVEIQTYHKTLSSIKDATQQQFQNLDHTEGTELANQVQSFLHEIDIEFQQLSNTSSKLAEQYKQLQQFWHPKWIEFTELNEQQQVQLQTSLIELQRSTLEIQLIAETLHKYHVEMKADLDEMRNSTVLLSSIQNQLRSIREQVISTNSETSIEEINLDELKNEWQGQLNSITIPELEQVIQQTTEINVKASHRESKLDKLKVRRELIQKAKSLRVRAANEALQALDALQKQQEHVLAEWTADKFELDSLLNGLNAESVQSLTHKSKIMEDLMINHCNNPQQQQSTEAEKTTLEVEADSSSTDCEAVPDQDVDELDKEQILNDDQDTSLTATTCVEPEAFSVFSPVRISKPSTPVKLGTPKSNKTPNNSPVVRVGGGFVYASSLEGTKGASPNSRKSWSPFIEQPANQTKRHSISPSTSKSPRQVFKIRSPNVDTMASPSKSKTNRSLFTSKKSVTRIE